MWKNNKKTSIFNQAFFKIPLPVLTDLQPVKIRLNNSVHSAFPAPLWYTHTRTWRRHTHMMGSQQYDLWTVIAACGQYVFTRQLTCIWLYVCVSILIVFLPYFLLPYLLPLRRSGCKVLPFSTAQIQLTSISEKDVFFFSPFQSEAASSGFRGLLCASSRVFFLFNFTPERLGGAAAAPVACSSLADGNIPTLSFQTAGPHLTTQGALDSPKV